MKSTFHILRKAVLVVLCMALVFCASCKQGDNASSNVETSVNKDNAMSAKDASYAITNESSTEAARLSTEKTVLYDFNTEWAYCHHPDIISFKGKLYAVWSNGRVHEDAPGQRIMLSSSEDGITWSTPKPLIDSEKGLSTELVMFPGGMYTDGETLVIYFRKAEHDPTSLTENGTKPTSENPSFLYSHFYYVTSTDGVTFSEPVKDDSLKSGGNRPPRELVAGRLFYAGQTSIAYTDDLSGISGWLTSAIPTETLNNAKEMGNLPIICESSLYVSSDNVLHMMLRTNSGYLWHSQSTDNGESWSELYPTRFSDDGNKTDFLNLSDGRVLYVGTPKNSGIGSRLPLCLAVSDDGYNFSKQYILRDEEYIRQQYGMFKSGNYGYPQMVEHNGYIYVIYSKQKEVIEVTRFALESIK